MRLRVLSNWSNGAQAYLAGQVIDVSDAQGELLMRDSPGSFAIDAGDSVPSADRRARGGKAR